MTHHGLLPRDLRKVERSSSKKTDLVPSLLVRGNGILVCMITIKALIKPNMVIVFDSIGNNVALKSTTHQAFLKDLQNRLAGSPGTTDLDVNMINMPDMDLPYEFRALETIFHNTLSNMTSELKVLLTICDEILLELEIDITRDKLRFLLSQNKKLTSFYRRATLIRFLLDDILEQDDTLCDMYLSDKVIGHVRHNDDHQEIEMLLENYHNHVDELVQLTENAITNVRNTEEIINIVLDSNRNELMLLGIKFSIGMLSLGAPLLVGSIYGMNLENFIEEKEYGYALALFMGTAGMGWLYFHSIKQLQKLTKMSIINQISNKK